MARVWGVMLFLAVWPTQGVVRAEEMPPGPTLRTGVLLLRNGEVLAGKVWSAGDQFYVELPAGEIRVREAEADCFCRDLNEAYQVQRQRIEATDAEQHLALAEWCLRNGLTGAAALELADALAADPRHARIPLVQRRLELMLAEPTAAVRTSAAVPNGPSNDELDRLVQSLPAGTMETFTSTIQPLLLNHCGTVACHGATAETPYRLLRMPADRSPTRRLTQRNLHATLAMVNREAPAESPLLVNSIRPHGGAESPVFSNRELARVRQLTAWVHRIAKQRQHQPATIEPATGLPRTMSNIGAQRAGGVPPSEPGADDGEGSAPQESTGEADPFDPEVFNRRFFPE